MGIGDRTMAQKREPGCTSAPGTGDAYTRRLRV